jgi:perosamine synthetase
MEIPMSSPDITQAEIQAVQSVLRTPILSIGPWLREFEDKFAEYIGVNHAVAVSSGTAALHLSTVALGIGDGDLVLTSPFSFVASANCLLYERAIPVFVDVDAHTGNLCPTRMAEAIEALSSPDQKGQAFLPPALRGGMEVRGTLKGILPVHAFGQPVDIDPISDLVQQKALVVIEDACEAVGAQYKAKRVGQFGDVGCFAFYPNKQMTTGEGGMLVTSRNDLAERFRSLRNQGRDIFDSWLNHTRLGFNYRLNEMSAALGVVQLGRIEELLSKREQVAAWYNERLACVDCLEVPCIASTTTRMSWFVYVVRFKSSHHRETAILALSGKNIPSRPYFSPIHLQPFYAEKFGYRKGDFPVAEKLGDTCLALPFSGVMSEDQVDFVCNVLINTFNKPLQQRPAEI